MPTINLKSTDDLEKIEEDVIKAAEKSGKKNVIVNIFTFPGKKLKRRWDVRYKFNKKHLVMDAVIAAGVLFLIGLNIFWAYGGFHYFTDKLEVKVAGGESARAGEMVTALVSYRNGNDYRLEEAVLSLRLPENFQLKKVGRDDYDYAHNILNLGNLPAGANGEFAVEGVVMGALGDEQALIASLNFYKTGKRGDRLWGKFSAPAQWTYQIADSFLALETSLPEKVVSGSAVTWQIKIKNTSDSLSFEKVIVKPEFSSELVGWTEPVALNNLTPGKQEIITMPVKFFTDTDYKNIALNVFWRRDGRDLLQSTWSKQQTVLRPEFRLTHSIVSKAVNPGENVLLTINYENAGAYTIENAVISLELIGDYWGVPVESAGAKVKGKTLTWNFENSPRLALIQPKGKGEIQVTIGTKALVKGSNDVILKSVVRATYRVEKENADFSDSMLETKLNSNLAVDAYPMYFASTGDQLGRGSLPPRVAKETKYWIFARVINDINDVDNVTATVTLPVNVVFTDKANVPVGDPLVYDEATRSLTWKISKAPASPSLGGPAGATNIGFAFEVAIIPTAGQKGTYPLLLSAVKVSGTDGVTGEVIEKNLGGVTTKLIYDAKGKLRDGVVK